MPETDYAAQSLTCSASSSSLELRKTKKDDYGTLDNSTSPKKKKLCCRYIPVEVVSFLFFTQIYLTLAYLQFFCHERATRAYDDAHPLNVTIRDNSSDLSRENAIQGTATLYLIVIMVCAILPCLVPVLLVGVLSDSFGRKVPMYMSSVGSILFSVIAIFVVKFDGTIYLLCIGACLSGLCGFFGTMQTSAYCIVADITEPGKSRAWRIIVLGMSIAAGNVIGGPIAGIWIDSSGYLDILYFSASLNIAALLVTIFFIPETLKKKSDVSFKENIMSIKDGFKFYLKDSVPNQRKKVLLCLVTFFTSFAVDVSKQIILGLYLLTTPFYWSPTGITIYVAARTVVSWVIIMLTSRCLARVMSDVNTAILGTVSSILGLVLTGVSINDAMMYIAALVSVYSEVVCPMIRSFLSRTAAASEQGSMFSVVSMCEMISASVLTVTSGIIYQKTLTIFPGFVFLMLAIAMLLLLGVLIVLSRLTKTTTTDEERTYQSYTVIDK